MSFNFNANQYNSGFLPNKLGNWEIPKWYPPHPRPRKGSTKIVANDRGHLLPHVPRPKSNPWGNFKNTWQLPNKISRKQAEEISSSLNASNKWNSPSRLKKIEQNPLGEDFQDNDNIDQPLQLEYIPGDLTNKEQQHPNRELLLQQKYEKDHNKESKLELNDLYLEKHQCNDQVAILNEAEKQKREIIPHILGEGIEDNFEKMKLHITGMPDKPNERNPSPLIPAIYNFQLAKKMAQENLEHQPLPDCIMDKAYRKLQAQGILNPGIALDVIPRASGVGIKTYKAGPTHCTKLRIYRPKTSGVVPKSVSTPNNLHRPMTSVPIENKMGSMDLAICWDYRPLNPTDEPKRTKHIDGSNGSAGPAIFTLVKTPRTPENLDTGRSGGLFTNTLGDEGFFDKDILRKNTEFAQKFKKNMKCTCGTSPMLFPNSKELKNIENDTGNNDGYYRSQSAARNGTITSDKRKRCKSSPNLSQIVNLSEDSYKENHTKYNQQRAATADMPRRHSREHTCSKYGPKNKEHRKSNMNIIKRTSRMCHKVAPQTYPEQPEKQEYKAAFKAGIPKSNSAGTISSFDSGCSTMSSSTCSTKVLNIPKPRHPYAKKNYNIDTLVPPFACLKGGAGQGGYPEHWRLASVYQHAYKPMEQRRRPLLQTVYK